MIGLKKSKAFIPYFLYYIKVNLFFKLLLSIPKTIYFNFRFLPIKQAIKLPVWVCYVTSLKIDGNISLLGKASFAKVRIGFKEVPACNNCDKTLLEIETNGYLSFMGTAHIGNGSKLYVARDASMILGNNFAVSSSSTILCYKRIVFGEDVQLSWDCLMMDSDTHIIYSENDQIINFPKEIVVGNKVWIGARCMILKGSIIPDNCVVGACSLISGDNFTPNTIIAGSPAKSIKKIGGFII